MSSGEQQLVAIFRTIFTNNQVIILDEATSNIDYATEQKIIKYLYEKLKGKTLIVIAHRINTIVGCDKIIVLKSGKIVEEGNSIDLLRNQKSLFY